ncbi:methyltransferase [Thermaurantiacus sp.]
MREASSLRDRLRAWRSTIVADARFRRFAARFPLTRPFARRATRDLFALCAGFVHSQVLAACVRLDLFGLLRAGPLAEAAIARQLDLPAEGARALLTAAEALGLLVRRDDGLWALADLGAVAASDAGIRAMVLHHAALYADLADPVALLRAPRGATALARYWAYAGAPAPGALAPESVADYSALMAASQAMIAGEILDAVDLSRTATLLDVAGGEGAFLIAAGARHPSLRLHLFDLPAVAARAAERFAAAGLAARARATGGDLFRDRLPQGADMVSLVRVVHDHDDAAAQTILRAARAALEPGGTLIVAEPMAGTPGAEPVGAYFAIYLWAMGQGRPRTFRELAAMAQAAGFARVRERRTATPLLVRVLCAEAA